MVLPFPYKPPRARLIKKKIPKVPKWVKKFDTPKAIKWELSASGGLPSCELLIRRVQEAPQMVKATDTAVGCIQTKT